MARNPAGKCWLLALPLLLILANAAAAAQFSALMMIKDGGKLMPAKINVQDGKMRQEFNDESGRTITIVRPDKKVVWIIMPRDRDYLEMPLKRKLPGQFLQIPPDALSKRLVGKESVNGYEAEKYEVTLLQGTHLEKQTIWLAPKLGAPVKMVCPQRQFSVEYRSVRQGPQSDRLFEIPPGYHKLSSYAGFAKRIEE